MIKLKKLIKEAAWDREFGEPLPTLKDVAEKHQGEGKESVNEVDFEKVKLPATVERFLNKFVESMKDANLNRIRRSAILYKVINASGMSPQQLMADIQKIKKELK
jgi:hypothetical protein